MRHMLSSMRKYQDTRTLCLCNVATIGKFILSIIMTIFEVDEDPLKLRFGRTT